MNKLLLGVNIDHIATLRNARNTRYPDPIHAAFVAEESGADSVTVHLREDRRHINERDLYILRQTLSIYMNLEMAVDNEIIAIACNTKPDFCCFVPEKRQEITTEGGLDVIKKMNIIYDSYCKLLESGVEVSLFIDPDEKQIRAAAEIGVPCVEIHTGRYSNLKDKSQREEEFKLISRAANLASSLGLKVKAGHGINYYNVQEIASLPELYELNIGHSIISRAVITGLREAILTMKTLIQEVRK